MIISNTMRFKVVLEEDEEAGGFVVSCPALPGCYSQGDTVKEALGNIKEAIQACLESLAEDEIKSYITKPSAKVVEMVA